MYAKGIPKANKLKAETIPCSYSTWGLNEFNWNKKGFYSWFAEKKFWFCHCSNGENSWCVCFCAWFGNDSILLREIQIQIFAFLFDIGLKYYKNYCIALIFSREDNNAITF